MKTLLLLIVFITVFITSCVKNQETKSKSCCSNEKHAVQPEVLSDESVYNLSSSWTNQKNEQMKLADFRNKIVVTAMVFTHCESACPRIVSDIQRIESSLTVKELEQVRFLLISMDPERDTPVRLKEFAAMHHLGTRWTLICSSPDATMEIANVLGVKVKKLADGGFDHSNIIHVLDRAGVIVKQQNGFTIEQDETTLSIRKLIQ